MRVRAEHRVVHGMGDSSGVLQLRAATRGFFDTRQATPPGQAQRTHRVVQLRAFPRAACRADEAVLQAVLRLQAAFHFKPLLHQHGVAVGQPDVGHALVKAQAL